MLCGNCGHNACSAVKCIGSSDTTKVDDGSYQKKYEAKGTRIHFNITDKEDLKRNVLKVHLEFSIFPLV